VCEFVIRQVDAAAVGRVAIERIPLPVNDCVRNAGVAASEGRTVVVRAGSTKVCERQVRKVEMPRRVHTSFGITAAKAGGDLSFKRRGTDNPLEGLTAVEGLPDPASIGGKRAGHASVQTIRIRGIDPQALLETNPANAADDRMPEAWRSGPRFRCGETDHSQHGANGTKSKSYEGARIKETGLRRGIFFHRDFPLLAAVEIVADNSKTPARPDAFFQITQNQPPKFVGGGLQRAFRSIGIDARSARRTDSNYEDDFVVVWIGMKP